MKVKFYVDSGANIHSEKSEVVDTVEDLGLEEGEWEQLSDDDKEEFVHDWKCNYLDWGWVDNP